MTKLSVSELLRLACIYAERDQEAYSQCTKESDPEWSQEADEFVKQIHDYRMKRWGPTVLVVETDSAVNVSIGEFLRR